MSDDDATLDALFRALAEARSPYALCLAVDAFTGQAERAPGAPGAELARRVLEVVCARPERDPAAIARAAGLVLTTHPAAAAFSLLRPALGGPADIADGVWRAVERLLDARSAGAHPPLTPPVDPGWRPLAERHAARADEVGRWATAVVDAFAWFGGGPVRALEDLELGEDDDPPFPFLLLGWAWDGWPGENTKRIADLDLSTRPMPRIVRFSHQFGGYACLHASLVGVALTLPEWRQEPVATLAASWWESAGEQMPASTLALFDAALPDLGPFVSGCEALLSGRSADPERLLARFAGRPLLQFERARAPWWPRGDLSLAAEVRISSASGLAEEHVTALARFGEMHALGAPRPLILWGNSD